MTLLILFPMCRMMVINRIPYCHFRATEESEVLGMDEDQSGERAYVRNSSYFPLSLLTSSILESRTATYLFCLLDVFFFKKQTFSRHSKYPSHPPPSFDNNKGLEKGIDHKFNGSDLKVDQRDTYANELLYYHANKGSSVTIKYS